MNQMTGKFGSLCLASAWTQRETTPEKIQSPENLSPMTLSKEERLHRWAALLERKGYDLVTNFSDLERIPAKIRRSLTVADSAITVAFADPELRAAGLEGEAYAHAQAFFQCSDYQLHQILCGCGCGVKQYANVVAIAVRCRIYEAHLFPEAPPSPVDVLFRSAGKLWRQVMEWGAVPDRA